VSKRFLFFYKHTTFLISLPNIHTDSFSYALPFLLTPAMSLDIIIWKDMYSSKKNLKERPFGEERIRRHFELRALARRGVAIAELGYVLA
jgi:hypothetical protein